MLERLNQALEHIEEHLEQRVDAMELARIAHTSEYHFRRMFSALAGMPLSEYVRRRRMSLAGAEVLAGRRTLLEIAVRYGYTSVEAFGRAFRSVHGVGPGQARRAGTVTLRTQPRLSFRLVVEGSSTMQYRVVDKDGFRIVGRRARVPLVHKGVNPAIADFVSGIGPETARRIAELSDQEPEGVVSVVEHLSDSREEGAELDYWHAVVSSRDPDAGDLDVQEVPAGTWAVFANEGPYPQALQDLWRDVYTQWFPSTRYVSRPGPEILRTRPTPDGAQARTELWIPVDRAES
ncbi:AraC family transcriptional regulator [Streptacidiphilus monticola]|uniref:GyrI-like domain-containing protein n=1 Tax=Streptacidiphilus monticola TaxID=2161674 RepID=A0ABW1G378_9ACTN